MDQSNLLIHFVKINNKSIPRTIEKKIKKIYL